MYTATVVVHGAIVNRHGFVSGQRFMAQMAYALLSCPCSVRGSRRAPYFIFNTLEFGHPLKTGYDFWVPAWAESRRLFSLRNVPRQLVMIWSEITANWDEFRVANLFGTGTYFVPAFVCLSVLGLAFVRVTPVRDQRISGGNSYFIATLTYAFVDGQVLPPYLFSPDCARRFACGVGCVADSQAALFHFSGWGADDIPAHLYWLSITIRL